MNEEIKKKYLAIDSFISGMEKYSNPIELDDTEEIQALLKKLKPVIIDIKLFEKMLREEIKEEEKIYLRTKMEEEIEAIEKKIADRFEKLDEDLDDVADKIEKNDKAFVSIRNWDLKKDSLEKGLGILEKSFKALLEEYNEQTGIYYENASLEERYRFFITFEKFISHETDSIVEQLEVLKSLFVKDAPFSKANASQFNDELVQNKNLNESVSSILENLMSRVSEHSEETSVLEEKLKEVDDEDGSMKVRKLLISNGLDVVEEKLSDLSDRIPETFYVSPVKLN